MLLQWDINHVGVRAIHGQNKKLLEWFRVWNYKINSLDINCVGKLELFLGNATVQLLLDI